ncbi:MAG: hypothetical protein JXQ75_01720 [Phycisphaerae bacterium]|nr:hypothetical protein [Phycisphaerae bacterium]
MIWHILFVLTVILTVVVVQTFVRLRRVGNLPARARAAILVALVAGSALGLWLGGCFFSYPVGENTRLIGFPGPVFILRLQADGNWKDYLRYAPLLVWAANTVFFVDMSLIVLLPILLWRGRSPTSSKR